MGRITRFRDIKADPLDIYSPGEVGRTKSHVLGNAIRVLKLLFGKLLYWAIILLLIGGAIFLLPKVPELWGKLTDYIERLRWDETPEELQGKNYIFETDWGVCYKGRHTNSRYICLDPDGQGFLSNHEWRAEFVSLSKGEIGIVINYSYSFLGPFGSARFQPVGRKENGTWSSWSKKKLPPLFPCTSGYWRWTSDSVHQEAVPYLKVAPKIAVGGKGCPLTIIRFFRVD